MTSPMLWYLNRGTGAVLLALYTMAVVGGVLGWLDSGLDATQILSMGLASGAIQEQKSEHSNAL